MSALPFEALFEIASKASKFYLLYIICYIRTYLRTVGSDLFDIYLSENLIYSTEDWESDLSDNF